MLRNPIGLEIEKVVAALTGRNFNPQDFFKPLEHYYTQLEAKARTITEWSEKQQFLNTVYEKFFQGFSVKVADTHGIVYTPQPIVDFMVKSVQHILKTEFGRSLAHENVHILDPFVGTGSFMMRIIREIGATQRSKLPQKYKNELHCNEVMLLPYYIASMNIEHEYYQQTKQYVPFDGICLVDTFELAEPHQTSLFTTENTERVEKQKRSPIFVIIGNPPYNAGQVNENDNNKNRKYPVIDKRVAETYAKESRATLKNALADPYVKAFRFASDRILSNQEGIVAFISNNSYLNEIAFDGMRKELTTNFDEILILDLGGNVRKNPKLSGTTHNVFGIQVGVSIIFLRRYSIRGQRKPARIWYGRVGEFLRRGEKYKILQSTSVEPLYEFYPEGLPTSLDGIEWKQLIPDEKGNWFDNESSGQYDSFIAICSKEGKRGTAKDVLFKNFSNGVKTNRDSWAYNFERNTLSHKMESMANEYNAEVFAWSKQAKKSSVDEFVNNDETKIKWSGDLKDHLLAGISAEFDENKIRLSSYRPFTKEYLFFDRVLNNRVYQLPSIFPTIGSESENIAICTSGVGSSKSFHCLIVKDIPCLDYLEKTQCFPFYTYDESGGNRKENITDWALEQFRGRVRGSSASPRGTGGSAYTAVTKWDIFYYVYGLLHHPGYRTKYAANLRRELPRIPLPKDAATFWALSEAGKKLADLHVNYESAQEYDLREEWHGEGLDLRVEKMRIRVPGSGSRGPGRNSNPDPGARAPDPVLIYNDSLTLTGIPPEAFEYRLGNRSALDWIVDQYQVSRDKRSGIVNDPNRAADPGYIVSLVKRVTTVSLETVRIVKGIERLELEPDRT